MKITAISDLHGHFPTLPGGDLLIVAGDLTSRDKIHEYIKYQKWIEDQKYKSKIIVAGNHDVTIERGLDLDFPRLGIHYLCDSGTEFEYEEEVYCNMCGTPNLELPNKKCARSVMCQIPEKKKLKIWGIPYSLWFPQINPKCSAFTGSEEYLKSRYDLIPNDIDILISHSPAYGFLDQNTQGVHCGSKSLLESIKRIKPRLVVHGHIHEQGNKIKSVFL